MLFDVRVFFEDYNGEEASTGIKCEGVSTLGDIDAFTLLFASAIEGLTDARSTKAEVRTKFSPTTPAVIKGFASSYDRLLVLCTNGERYGSITIPAPKTFPYLPKGNSIGYVVDKTAPSLVADIEALVSFLATTVLPDGTNFPASEWQAALMVPR